LSRIPHLCRHQAMRDLRLDSSCPAFGCVGLVWTHRERHCSKDLQSPSPRPRPDDAGRLILQESRNRSKGGWFKSDGIAPVRGPCRQLARLLRPLSRHRDHNLDRTIPACVSGRINQSMDGLDLANRRRSQRRSSDTSPAARRV
jgi:hypothetical protein